MIAKMYQLYQESTMAEEMERRAKDIYKKPAGAGKKAVVEEYEEVINLNDEESGFGAMPTKNNKNKGKQIAKAQASAATKVAPKKKTAEQIAGTEEK